MSIQAIPKNLHPLAAGVAPLGGAEPLVSRYAELTTMLDRLHRRYLEVIRMELEDIGVNDVNPSQALMLMMLSDGEAPLRDLLQRGGYSASTAAYMIKKLVDHGYLEQSRAAHDRRTVRLRLTRSGKKVVEQVTDLNRRHAETASMDERLAAGLEETTVTLRKLDRIWTDFLTFGELDPSY